jgi:hypothetical protein
VGSSEDCESEYGIDDCGTADTDNEEELLRKANPTKTEIEKQQHILQLQQKSIGSIKPKTR